MGAQVAEFERAAAEKCGVAHAIGCSSGTDALWLALEGAGIGPGDAVVTTAFSFFATVSAILRAGAQPLLADIDPETFNLDPAAAKACLESAAARRSCNSARSPLWPDRRLGLLRACLSRSTACC
jgi:dTDP-4-amino-4,6-dideoxygalactose transaminase